MNLLLLEPCSFFKCPMKDTKFGDLAQFYAYSLKKINTVRIFKYMHWNNSSMLKIYTNFQSTLSLNKVTGKFKKNMYKPW
jgi:hypothetical protein